MPGVRPRGRHAQARPPGGRGRTVAAIVQLSLVAGLAAGLLALPVAGVAGIAARDAAQTFNDLSVPSLTSLPTRSEILDSSGGLMAYYYPNHIYRVPVDYSQISVSMRHAIVAIEDARYFQHGALDVRGTMRAAAADLSGRPVQGGSTIAQEYAKNALVLSAADAAQQRAATTDSAARKIRELRVAAAVEHKMTPDQLLASYLNVAYFSNQAYGVQVAAQRYFGVTAAQLSLPQAALLAGLVQSPDAYDPLAHPAAAVGRRNVVLARMEQLHYITPAAAKAAQRAPVGVHYTPQQEGCADAAEPNAKWFCDYVVAEMRTNPAYTTAWHQLNTTGGLRIYTTMSRQDQVAAEQAVSFMVPAPPSPANPGDNAAAEVLVEPGTGKVKAIAVDRPYGFGPLQDSIDYAVDTAQNGGAGVQTGSSSKIFTLIAALKQDIPFGFKLNGSSPAVLGGYYNCAGQPDGSFPVANAEAGKGTYSLYTGTTQSINVFYARLEQRVGLCNTVKTAVSMGVHRSGGGSLLAPVGTPVSAGYQMPADDVPSFTLGSVEVSPMTMAGAYAAVAAGGVYCTPVAVSAVVGPGGRRLPVAEPGCHRVFSTQVAAAATHILQGVLTTGTAAGDSVPRAGGEQAGKTGTADNFDFAAFAGYTPHLAGYVSMFNPSGPVTHPMSGAAACFRAASGGEECPGSVFGASAGQIWQETFRNADLGASVGEFTAVPASSSYFRLGPGTQLPKPPKPAKDKPRRRARTTAVVVPQPQRRFRHFGFR